jgi:hypothetical protein
MPTNLKKIPIFWLKKTVCSQFLPDCRVNCLEKLDVVKTPVELNWQVSRRGFRQVGRESLKRLFSEEKPEFQTR